MQSQKKQVDGLIEALAKPRNRRTPFLRKMENLCRNVKEYVDLELPMSQALKGLM